MTDNLILPFSVTVMALYLIDVYVKREEWFSKHLEKSKPALHPYMFEQGCGRSQTK